MLKKADTPRQIVLRRERSRQLGNSRQAGLALPGRVSIPPRVPMSSSNGRNRGRPPYLAGKRTPWQPGDERNGDYSREHLLKMDARFRDRIERAFRLGLESRADAAGHVAASGTLCVNLTVRVRARDLQQTGPPADCISWPTPVESSEGRISGRDRRHRSNFNT